MGVLLEIKFIWVLDILCVGMCTSFLQKKNLGFLSSLTMEKCPDIVRQNATSIELYKNNREYIYVLGGSPKCCIIIPVKIHG